MSFLAVLSESTHGISVFRTSLIFSLADYSENTHGISICIQNKTHLSHLSINVPFKS